MPEELRTVTVEQPPQQGPTSSTDTTPTFEVEGPRAPTNAETVQAIVHRTPSSQGSQRGDGATAPVTEAAGFFGMLKEVKEWTHGQE